MLFPAKRRCHSGSLRETGGVQSCVLISCPESFSPTTNCPITRAKCASSASYRATYTQIATISTDDHHTLQEFRASVGAEWTFLSDPDRTIQKDLDIQEYADWPLSFDFSSEIWSSARPTLYRGQ
jgi:peroxiredoxin